MKDREERQSCCFSARVKQGLRWLDAQIANHSSRGLMLRMPMPPSAGSFIEIRRGDKVMIGQVRWSRDGQCGVQLRDRITMATLRDIPGHMTATRRTTPTGEYVERRATVRPIAPSHGISNAQILGRKIERVGLGVMVVLGAAMLAGTVFDSLKTPLERAGYAMSGQKARGPGSPL